MGSAFLGVHLSALLHQEGTVMSVARVTFPDVLISGQGHPHPSCPILKDRVQPRPRHDFLPFPVYSKLLLLGL